MSEMKYTVLIAGLAAASLLAAGCEQRVGSAPPNPPTTIINKTEPNPPTTVINKTETTTQSGQPDQSSSSSTTTTSSSGAASSDQKATASAETKNAQPSKDTKSNDKQG
jgi:hypothetical protein